MSEAQPVVGKAAVTTRTAVTRTAVTRTAVTRKEPAALRHVVDLALRGIRAKSRTPHPARPHGEARWVMSSDGVIGPPSHDPQDSHDPHDSHEENNASPA